MPLIRTCRVLTLAIGAALACESLADAYDENDLLQLSLQELSQVSITGSTHSEQSIATVPAAVTVFTHEEIERMGISFLHELLAFVPGYQSVRTSDDALSATYDSRGRRNSSQSREVVLLIDGRPFNDPRTGAINTDVRQLPLQQFERVEVIRGPGSAVYGSNAFTGVINLITRKNVNEVRVAVGSFGRLQLQGLASIKHNAWQLDAFAFGDSDDGDDYHVLEGTPGNYQTTSTQDPRELQHIDLQLQHADTRVMLQHRRDHTEDFYIGGGVNDDFRHYTGEINQLTLQQALRWSDDFKSELQADILQTDLDVNIQFLRAGTLAAISNPAGATAPMLGKADFNGERLSLRWHNDWNIDTERNLQFGAQWSRDEETRSELATNYDLTQLSSGIRPINYYGNYDHVYPFGREEDTRRVSVYGQYQQTWLENTHLTLGMRHDESNIDSYLSPRLGLVQEFSKRYSIKLLYGEAFRSPALTETGTMNSPAVVGNPNLDNEVVKTWDLIWVAQWQQTRLIAGVFHNHYENPITAAVVGNVRTYINATNENSQGFELELRHQLSTNLLLGAAWTALDNLPDSAYKEAEHFGSIMMNYQIEAWNWNVGAIYQGEREMLAPPSPGVPTTIDNYWLVQTKLSYALQKNWLLYLQARNAFDKDYLTPTDGNTLAQGVPARGRELLFGTRFVFF